MRPHPCGRSGPSGSGPDSFGTDWREHLTRTPRPQLARGAHTIAAAARPGLAAPGRARTRALALVAGIALAGSVAFAAATTFGRIATTRGAVPSWTWQSPSPQGNTILGMSFATTDTGWAVGASGVVLKTADGGGRWASLDAGAYHDWYGASFVSEQTGWIAGSGGSIEKTLDGGSTWAAESVPAAAGTTFRGISALGGSQAIAVGGTGSSSPAIAYTADGSTWVSARTSAHGQLRAVAFPAEGLAWAVGTDGVMLKSTDDGATWAATAPLTSRTLNAIAFAKGTAIGYAVGDADGSRWTALKTTDGATWTALRLPGGAVELEAVACDPSGAHVTVTGTAGAVYRSDDGGVTWTAQRRLGLAPATVRAAAMPSVSQLDLAGDGGAMLLSRDAGRTGLSPRQTSLYDMRSVARAGSTLYAVGSAGVLMRSTDDGASWSGRRIAPGVTLRGVAFADARNGLAVGDGGAALQTSDGGATWTAASTGTSATLDAVAMLDAKTAVAVGAHGTLLTWDGTTWTANASHTAADLYGVAFGSDAGSAWAVGARGTIVAPAPDQDITGTWSARRSGTTLTLRSVSAAGPVVLAAGDGGTVLRSTNGGATWDSAGAALSAPVQLLAVSVARTHSGGLDAWAGGAGGFVARSTDGGLTWSQVSAGLPTDAPDAPTAVRSLVTVDGDDCALVGSDGETRVTADGGATWRSGAYGVTADLNAIASIDPRTAWAVGADGTIASTFDGGETWFRQPSGSSAELRGIVMTSASAGWAVGDSGTIRHTADGGWSWTSQDTSTTAQLRSVDATADLAIAVGAGGTVLRTADAGASWTAASAPTSEAINGVAIAGPTVWAVADASKDGSAATILKSGDNGSTWSTALTGVASLYAVTFRPGGLAGWAVGAGGTVLHTADGGATWTPQHSGTGADLLAVSFSSDATGVASGTGGTVVRTADGGATWTADDSGTDSRTLRGAALWGPTQGWLVGDAGAVLAGRDPRSPMTTALVTPAAPDGDNGWYTTAPSVQLLPDMSSTTLYRWTPPGGSLLAYQSELAAPEGVSTLAFHSDDGFGGVEAEQSLTFRVDSQAPSAPAAVTVSGATRDSVDLSWQASTDAGASGVAGYDVYVDGAYYASSATTGITLSGLPYPNMTYSISVVARDGAGNASAPGAAVTAITAGDATDALGTSVTVSPAAPDGDNGWYVTTPTVALAPVPATQPAPGGVSLYALDTTASAGAAYAAPFTVGDGVHMLWAWSVATDGSQGARGLLQLPTPLKVDTVTPQAPATLTATPTSDSTVHLAWSAAVDDTVSGIDGYEVFMDGARIATVPTSTLSWEVVGLAADAQHTFAVRSVSAAGTTSAPTPTETARTAAWTLPTAPALVYARGTDGQTVHVAWTPSVDARTPASYVVERSDGGGTFAPIATVEDPDQAGYTDTGLSAETTYTYRVSVVDPRGTSAPSATASAATGVPVRVRSLQATAASSTPGAVVLTWAPSANAGVAGYVVYRSRVSLATAPAGAPAPSDLVTVTASPVAATFFIDTGLTTGLDYYYRVAAVDVSGGVGPASAEAMARPVAALPADAVDPHGGATTSDHCADCHAVHQAHSANLLFGSHETTPSWYAPSSSGYSPARATWDDARNCTSCHSGSQGPDVLTALNDPLTASPQGSRHGIVTSGSSQSGSLLCGSCHRAHGTGTANPERLDVNGATSGPEVCYGCHGSGSTLPGGDTRTFSNSAHAAITGQDQPAGVACLTCHASKSATNPRLLRYDGSMACVTCHAGSGGSGASDVLGASDASGGGTHVALPVAGATGDGSRLACENCHDAMRGTKSAPLADPASPYGTTWTGDGNSFCLRCHDGSYPTAAQTDPVPSPLGVGGTSLSADIGSAYATNVHGAGVATDGKSGLLASMGYTTGMTLSCQTCHDPHGSVNAFSLKESVSSADGSVVKSGLLVAPVAGGGYDFRLFCASCHTLPAHATSAPFPSDCTGSGCHQHTMAPLGPGGTVTGTAF